MTPCDNNNGSVEKERTPATCNLPRDTPTIDRSDFVEYPEPAPSQLALSQIYQDALHKHDPTGTAAKRLGDWVLSVSDRDTCYDIANAYSDVLMLISSAARELSSRKHLQILADIIVELANLPDVYNDTEKLTVLEECSIAVLPGERIKLHS